jgi:hypothetical protein
MAGECPYLVAKFTEGAWITTILVPALIITMIAVKRHYDRVACQIAVDCPMRVKNSRSLLSLSL